MLLRFFKRFFLFSHPAFSQFKDQGCPGCCQEQSCRPHSRELRILCLRSLCILSARRCRCHFCSSVPGSRGNRIPLLRCGTAFRNRCSFRIRRRCERFFRVRSRLRIRCWRLLRLSAPAHSQKLFRLLCQRYIQFAVSLIYKLQRIRNQA